MQSENSWRDFIPCMMKSMDTMIDTVYVYDKKRIEVILRFDDVLQKVISEYMEGAKGA